MNGKNKNYAINILKTRLKSHQDILADKDWASENDDTDKQSRKRLRMESKELKEAIHILSKFNQPTVSELVCECKNLPKGEIAISSKALSDPNWTDERSEQVCCPRCKSINWDGSGLTLNCNDCDYQWQQNCL